MKRMFFNKDFDMHRQDNMLHITAKGYTSSFNLNVHEFRELAYIVNSWVLPMNHKKNLSVNNMLFVIEAVNDESYNVVISGSNFISTIYLNKNKFVEFANWLWEIAESEK